MLSGINVGLGLINISSGLSLICYRITGTDSSGTRDHSTDFLLSRYVKFHVNRIAVFYVAVFW